MNRNSTGNSSPNYAVHSEEYLCTLSSLLLDKKWEPKTIYNNIEIANIGYGYECIADRLVGWTKSTIIIPWIVCECSTGLSSNRTEEQRGLQLYRFLFHIPLNHKESFIIFVQSEQFREWECEGLVRLSTELWDSFLTEYSLWYVHEVFFHTNRRHSRSRREWRIWLLQSHWRDLFRLYSACANHLGTLRVFLVSDLHWEPLFSFSIARIQ